MKVKIKFKSKISRADASEKISIKIEGAKEGNTFTFIEENQGSNYENKITFLSDAVEISRAGLETKMHLLLFKDKQGLCKYHTPHGVLIMQTIFKSYKANVNEYHVKYQLLQNEEKIGDYEIFLKYEKEE